MTPDCCKNCEHLCAEGGCKDKGKECYKWRAWFRKEWTNIQKAAARLREENKKEKNEK